MTRLDITRDVCPMTTVKVGMSLARLAPAGSLEVRLKEDALVNVMTALKRDGHRVAVLERGADGIVLRVTKGGAAGPPS